VKTGAPSCCAGPVPMAAEHRADRWQQQHLGRPVGHHVPASALVEERQREEADQDRQVHERPARRVHGAGCDRSLIEREEQLRREELAKEKGEAQDVG
jgi:hypothetical protein